MDNKPDALIKRLPEGIVLAGFARIDEMGEHWQLKPSVPREQMLYIPVAAILDFFLAGKPLFHQVVNVTKQRFMRMLGLTTPEHVTRRGCLIDKDRQQKVAKKSKMAAVGSI